MPSKKKKGKSAGSLQKAAEEPGVAPEAPGAPTQESQTSESVEQRLYSQLPPFIEIRVHEKSGRGLWLKEGHDVKAGTTLVRVAPHGASVSTHQLGSTCSACFLPGAQQRCTACGSLQYCSRECQKADWPAHKEECKAIRRVGGVPMEQVRTMARLLWSGIAKGHDSVWWKEVIGMHSDLGQRPKDYHKEISVVGLQVLDFMGLRNEMLQNPQAPFTKLGFDTLHDFYNNFLGTFSVNSFSIQTPELNFPGVFVSPLCALMNHSCDPNVGAFFPWGGGAKGTIEIIALRDLKGGEELLNTYVDTALPWRERAPDLAKRYMFTCDCSVCTNERGPLFVSPRQCIKCPSETCPGRLPLPEIRSTKALICNACQQSFDVDLAEIWKVVDKGVFCLKLVEESQYSDPPRAHRLISQSLPPLSQHLPPTAHPLMQLIHIHQSVCILLATASSPHNHQNIEDAIQCGHILTASVPEVYSPHHPIFSTELRNYAHVLCMRTTAAPAVGSTGDPSSIPDKLRGRIPVDQERMKLVRALLDQAYEVSTVGFGAGGGRAGQAIKGQIADFEQRFKGVTKWPPRR